MFIDLAFLKRSLTLHNTYTTSSSASSIQNIAYCVGRTRSLLITCGLPSILFWPAHHTSLQTHISVLLSLLHHSRILITCWSRVPSVPKPRLMCAFHLSFPTAGVGVLPRPLADGVQYSRPPPPAPEAVHTSAGFGRGWWSANTTDV